MENKGNPKKEKRKKGANSGEAKRGPLEKRHVHITQLAVLSAQSSSGLICTTHTAKREPQVFFPRREQWSGVWFGDFAVSSMGEFLFFLIPGFLARSSSGEVRISCYQLCSVYVSRGALPTKKGVRKGT